MDSIAAARAALPWWVVWGPVVVYPALLFIASWLAAHVGIRIALRPFLRTQPAHETERSRLSFPARNAAAVNVGFLTAAGTGLAAVYHSAFVPLPPELFFLFAGAAAFAPALHAYLDLDRRLRFRRMLDARREPDYPRLVPPRLPDVLGTAVSVLLFLMLGLAPRVTGALAERVAGRTPVVLYTSLAMGDVDALYELARICYRDNDAKAAMMWLRAGSKIEPGWVAYPARLAMVLAEEGRCAEARDELDEARKRQRTDRSGDRWDRMLGFLERSIADCEGGPMRSQAMRD
jgi:hypothetical protein